MRRLICLTCATLVLVCTGCSTGHKQATVYTFSQADGGNVSASDSLGTSLSFNKVSQSARARESMKSQTAKVTEKPVIGD